jgi:hypothetical protein
MHNIEINIPYISEKDFDLLIIEEFLSSKDFQNIFLNPIGIQDIELLSLNHSLSTIDGESDIVITFKHIVKIIGLFIEDKIDAIAIPFQYQRYEERAKQMMIEIKIDIIFSS